MTAGVALFWTYVVIAVGGALVVGLLGLRDALRTRWYAYIDRQVGPVLERERERHAKALATARAEHRDAQAWLRETHRMELARAEAHVQRRITEAVVEAMTNVAPHPIRRAW